MLRRVTTPPEPVLAPVRRAFRSLASTILPAAELGPSDWQELEARVETALADRPPRLRRQLRLFIRAVEWAPVLRRGRRFSRLDPARRAEILQRLQRAPALVLRRGFWGLRTLVFLGYYGRPDVRRAIGYRADPRGWAARPAADTAGSDLGASSETAGTDGRSDAEAASGRSDR